MVVQGLSRALFYSKNNKFVLKHFNQRSPPILPENIRKYHLFSGISGFKWNIGWEFLLLQNSCSATVAKNLKKPVQEFIFSKNEGWTLRYFVFVEPLCGWLSLVKNKQTSEN